MERVYISGPITGVENYLKRFRDAERDLIYKGYTSIVNPAEVSRHLPEDFTHEEYMRVCLAELECCSTVLMLRGWENSKGARIEKEFAEKKGMTIVYQ